MYYFDITDIFHMHTMYVFNQKDCHMMLSTTC